MDGLILYQTIATLFSYMLESTTQWAGLNLFFFAGEKEQKCTKKSILEIMKPAGSEALRTVAVIRILLVWIQ